MANGNLAFKSKDKAMGWVAQAKELNNETQQALAATAAAIKEVGDYGAGELVDKLVDVARGVTDFTAKIYDGVNQITNGIVQVIDTVADTIGAIASGIGKVFGL